MSVSLLLRSILNKVTMSDSLSLIRDSSSEALQRMISGSSVTAGDGTSGASKVLESARSTPFTIVPSGIGGPQPSGLQVIKCFLRNRGF